jgi:hypothetical protein
MHYTTTQPKIPAIAHQPVLKKSTFVFALAVFGVFSALAGIISLVTAIILSSNASMPSLAETMLFDAVYEFGLSALIFASSRAFSKGRLLSVWLYGSSLVLDSFYNLMTGNPLNYLFVGFGLFVIWQILRYRSQLELK